ncbi:MAG: tail fiber domain-containing protein [Pseudomonadota bacterium]|nr:tail fiber domain-containing protein [Pseudomonadota bacterium]
MGFFSGSKKTTKTGYYSLPDNLKGMIDRIASGSNQYVTGENNISRFTPMAQTADETRAFDILRQGFAPTQQSLASDINLQMNPYNQSVIGAINRQAGGEYSILKQAMNEAGQMGSNRQMLGANDIDLTRTQQIGSFLQGQFDKAMQNSLTVLPQLRAADAQGLLGIGEFQRGLESQTKQAPVTALQTATGLAQGLGLNSAIANTSQTTQKSGGLGASLLGAIGGGLSAADKLFGGGAGAAGAAGAAAGGGGFLSGLGSLFAFSDRRLKENIKGAGEENGHRVYRFNYRGDDRKYIGVMADEVLETHPEAVAEMDGYLAVDYSKIGVRFREV